MKLTLTYSLALLLAFSLSVESSTAQRKKKKRKNNTEQPAAENSKKGGMKSYDKVITSEAITDEGLFDIHLVDDKYYFEINKDLLDKEILIVSRVSGFVKNLSFGGAGGKSRPQQVIRFQKKDNSLLLRSVSYNSVASEEDPIYESVKNNNTEPIVFNFKIEAMKEDSSSYVIDVSDFFTSDIAMIGPLSDRQRKNFKIKGLDSKRSLINSIKSYPKNVEVRHLLTFVGDNLPDNQITESLTVEMNQSMILLPEDPWMPRYYDDRVGFFSVRQTDYSMDEQKAASKRFITRWRLEPKDWEAYLNGELVEPVKPIVYYVDPATPTKWVPYIKKGIEDWQSAVEKAGLKKAIIAADPPSREEDPEWSPEDVRYSVVRYISTEIQNAVGPHVHDPRTGEILESDILWYHNVMNLLRNWYFVQTAAINPEAQSYKFEDEVMGELIRFVAAHEVGHTLGFPHNMGSSVAYPVDSLRSPTFTATRGTAPSIMDYARFNYIAQPGDGVENLNPKIGPYDEWATIFGYKLTDAETPEEDRIIISEWVKDRAGDPLYRYGRQRGGFSNFDPSAQTEDLGDDAMRAGELGVANLKRIVPRIREWGSDENKTYEDIKELYRNVFSQFRRYVGHVGTNIGGVYEMQKRSDQEGAVFIHTPKEKQQRAVKWLNEYLFETPEWLLEEDIINKINQQGVIDNIRSIQDVAIRWVMHEDRLIRMIENEALNGSEAYTLVNLFDDMRNGIFSELSTGAAIDPFRRNLQKTFIMRVGELSNTEDSDTRMTDVVSVTRGNLNLIKNELNRARSRYSDAVSKFHVEDAIARIDDLLDRDD